MANTCFTEVRLISDDEYIGDSLPKINENFQNLKNAACIIEKQIDDVVNVRTFFYYGPNSATNSESGMNPNSISIPSNSLIESFVNDNDKLDLPKFSEQGDIAYVIYQKTGWYDTIDNHIRSGSGSVPYSRVETRTRTERYRVRRIGIGYIGTRTRTVTEYVTVTYYAGYNWTASVNDAYKSYTPVFVIYKLNFNGSSYSLETGFPKLSRASTASTLNWNNPASWSTY